MASESYFLGVDVGTGSARVCIIDSTGEIKGVESKEIQTWNPRANYYVSIPATPRISKAKEFTGTIDSRYLVRNLLL